MQAIIFDMDGVLVDNQDIHRKAWVEFCRRIGHPIDPADFDRVGFGRKNKEFLRYFLQREVSGQEAKILGEKKEAVYRELAGKEIQPVNGLIPFLRSMKKEYHLKTAVASSAPRSNIDFVLKKLLIGEFFDVLADASLVDQGKPHPSIYLKTAELLDLPPAQCLVFEDSLFGVESALQAGMQVVALTTSHSYKELSAYPCRDIIRDFSELNEEKMQKLIR
ncbi:MAG: HAD family phosphatase [Bacteroidales bacterium]|nr:HAD family phosphatase [Bacteroidales bacterium]